MELPIRSYVCSACEDLRLDLSFWVSYGFSQLKFHFRLARVIKSNVKLKLK